MRRYFKIQIVTFYVLINSAFVGKSSFVLIKMHGKTIKIFPRLSNLINTSLLLLQRVSLGRPNFQPSMTWKTHTSRGPVPYTTHHLSFNLLNLTGHCV